MSDYDQILTGNIFTFKPRSHCLNLRAGAYQFGDHDEPSHNRGGTVDKDEPCWTGSCPWLFKTTGSRQEGCQMPW